MKNDLNIDFVKMERKGELEPWGDWGMVTKEQRDKVKGTGEEKDKCEENRRESEEKV